MKLTEWMMINYNVSLRYMNLIPRVSFTVLDNISET